jgi:hypothetical protein
MTRRYHVLPAADRDLHDQAAYLVAEASLEIALRFYDAANITFDKIDHPVAQFSTCNPGTALKSLSLLTTVQLPRANAIASE